MHFVGLEADFLFGGWFVQIFSTMYLPGGSI